MADSASSMKYYVCFRNASSATIFRVPVWQKSVITKTLYDLHLNLGLPSLAAAGRDPSAISYTQSGSVSAYPRYKTRERHLS